jgi:hypothetical protein
VKDPFNADFYSVIATVIPVLYLAIAVQGSTFSTLLNWLRALVIRTQGRIVELTERRVKLRRKLGNKGLRGILVFINVLGYSVVLAVALSLILSLLAEVFAILALYDRQENPHPALFIIPGGLFIHPITGRFPTVTLATRPEKCYPHFHSPR